MQAVPHKQYHAPAQRGSTTYPGAAAMALAADWTVVLALCFGSTGALPRPAASLLSDLVQLLYYHPQPPKDNQDDDAEELPQKTAGSSPCSRPLSTCCCVLFRMAALIPIADAEIITPMPGLIDEMSLLEGTACS